MPAELAPFVAQARARIEQATDGLATEAAIEHLEATVERAAVEASRLGFHFPVSEPTGALPLDDGQVPVVVVQRLGGAETA